MTQYGLSWPNTRTTLVREGRNVAYGLARIWAKTGIVPTVVMRDGWKDDWRADTAPAPKLRDGGAS